MKRDPGFVISENETQMIMRALDRCQREISAETLDEKVMREIKLAKATPFCNYAKLLSK